jgi:hypothetical protein
MAILMVGMGEKYTTIAAAVQASHSGDTIKIDAGTYIAADLKISNNLIIEAVGNGPVNVVAPTHPNGAPNVDKGLFVVGTATSAPNVTIEGLTFSGAKSSAYNGAGIRYQSGNLTLIGDTFHDNQDGLLATPFVYGTGNVNVQGSTFDHNGGGDGYSHNIYIGFINSFTLTDSVSEHADVGHEVKSRALNNVIENNQIIDGLTGTASYSIDLPDGGNDIVQGNTIEKGPLASTGVAIHIGGQEALNPSNVVQISGNTVINDYGAKAVAIRNQMPLSVTATGNMLVGFNTLMQGYGTLTGSTNANAAALSPVTSTTYGSNSIFLDYSADPNNETVILKRPSTTVQGGAGHLTITTSLASETFVGGSGGMTINDSKGAFVITAPGSTNQISLGTGGGTMQSFGNDTIVLPTIGPVITSVYGRASITASSGASTNAYHIMNGGNARITELGGNDSILVRSGGTLKLTGSNNHLDMNETGGTISFGFTNAGVERSGIFMGGAVEMSQKGAVSIYSGAPTTATLYFNRGTFTVSDSAPATICAGAATVTVTASNIGAGTLTFMGGSGVSHVAIGATSAARISAGTGTVTVSDQSKVGVEFDINAVLSGGGTLDITGYNATRDKLVFQGFDKNPIVSQSVVGGSLHLNLQNHATVILEHLTHM